MNAGDFNEVTEGSLAEAMMDAMKVDHVLMVSGGSKVTKISESNFLNYDVYSYDDTIVSVLNGKFTTTVLQKVNTKHRVFNKFPPLRDHICSTVHCEPHRSIIQSKTKAI